MGQDELRRLEVLESGCRRQQALSICLGAALVFSWILTGARSCGGNRPEELKSAVPHSGQISCDTIEARWLKIVDESGHLRGVFGMTPHSRNPELSLRYGNGKLGFKAGMHDGQKSSLWLLDHEGQAGFRMTTTDDTTEPMVQSYGGGQALIAGMDRFRTRSRTRFAGESNPDSQTTVSDPPVLPSR